MVKNVLIDFLPLWSILPLAIVVSLVSVEVGYRIASYRQRGSLEEKESPVGGMVGATVGLLGFMLAFTFGIAGSRFEDRRQVLLSEANAIGTTYLRAAMLPEPIRTETQNLLREYVDVRLEAVQPGRLNQALVKSEELHNKLWSRAVAATEKDRSVITGLFVQSLNEVIDLHAKRVMAGLRSRVPDIIWIVLFVLAILAMVMMGYHSGLAHSRRSIAVIALILGFSSVLYLIADLDRPGQGTLRVSQQSMIALRHSMK
jgi:amino acid permease